MFNNSQNNKNDKEKRSRFNSGNSEKERDIEEIEETMLSEFKEQFKKQNDLINELKNSYKFMSDNFDKLLKEMKQIKIEQKVMKNNMATIQEKEEKLEKQIIIMESQLMKCKQEINNNNMIITNIPKLKAQADVNKVVEKIAQQVNYELKKEEIMELYQMESKNKKSYPIIVKLNSNQFKNTCMNFRKEKNAIDIKKIIPNSNNNKKNINFFHFLEREYIYLLGKAKEIAKEKKYKYIWYANATIMIRREDESKIIKIRCEDDLKRIV